MWVGDVDVDALPPQAASMVRSLIKKIKMQQEEIEELKRHVRGQSRRVGKLKKELKGEYEQLEIEMGGNVV